MEAKGYMDRGELVPDRLVVDLILARLTGDEPLRGFVLDGFPRSLTQARDCYSFGRARNTTFHAVHPSRSRSDARPDYFRAASDGMFSLMELVGLGPTEIRARQMSFAVVHAETDFMAELIAGDVIALRSGVQAIGTQSAEFRHELINVASDQTVMSTRFKCVLLDLERRVAVQVPPDIRDRLTALPSPSEA